MYNSKIFRCCLVLFVCSNFPVFVLRFIIALNLLHKNLSQPFLKLHGENIRFFQNISGSVNDPRYCLIYSIQVLIGRTNSCNLLMVYKKTLLLFYRVSRETISLLQGYIREVLHIIEIIKFSCMNAELIYCLHFIGLLNQFFKYY